MGPWTPASEGHGPLWPCQGVPVKDSPDIGGPGVWQLRECWHNSAKEEKKWSVCGLRVEEGC